jgi:hypothetical protein
MAVSCAHETAPIFEMLEPLPLYSFDDTRNALIASRNISAKAPES